MYVCAVPYFLYNLNVFVSPEMHNYVFLGGGLQARPSQNGSI